MRFFAPLFFAVLSNCCFFIIFSEVPAHTFCKRKFHDHIPFGRLFSCQRTFRTWFSRRVHTLIFTRRAFQPSILDCWKTAEKLTPTVKLFLGRLFSTYLLSGRKIIVLSQIFFTPLKSGIKNPSCAVAREGTYKYLLLYKIKTPYENRSLCFHTVYYVCVVVRFTVISTHETSSLHKDYKPIMPTTSLCSSLRVFVAFATTKGVN